MRQSDVNLVHPSREGIFRLATQLWSIIEGREMRVQMIDIVTVPRLVRRKH